MNIFARFGFTHDGVLDEELFLEIVANLLGGHGEGGWLIDGSTRRHDLDTDAPSRANAYAIDGSSRNRDCWRT